MAKYSPNETAKIIGTGLLSFPVTHFDENNEFDESGFKNHCESMLGYELAGLFAAGGTGEFFSLNSEEHKRVVKAAVEITEGQIPVVAGCGYGTAMAIEMARNAQDAGADAILLLPPYLVNSTQNGLAAHITEVCKAIDIGVIVYNRDNGIIEENALERLCDNHSNLVGYKDGIGDIELMTKIYTKIGDRLTYIGGLPTAETYALPYLQTGVTTYSSAIFNFMPEWAIDFYKAVRAQDIDFIMRELKEFVMPYIALRNNSKGYAVSIVKAGMKIIGRDAGCVRSPLTDLTGAEMEILGELIGKAKARSLDYSNNGQIKNAI